MGRRERRRKELRHDHNTTGRHWKVKEEAMDRTYFRNCCCGQSRRNLLQPERKLCSLYYKFRNST